MSMDSWRERLAFEIHARGMKLTKLSTSLGFHRDYVSNVISGKAKPSADKLESICKALGIELADLLLSQEAKKEHKKHVESELNDNSLRSVQHMIVDGRYDTTDG